MFRRELIARILPDVFLTRNSAVGTLLLGLRASRIGAIDTASPQSPQATAGVCIATLQFIEQRAFKIAIPHRVLAAERYGYKPT